MLKNVIYLGVFVCEREGGRREGDGMEEVLRETDSCNLKAKLIIA